MARRERINVEMLVEAISAGFDRVQADIQKLATAQAKTVQSSQQYTQALTQQESMQQAMSTRVALLTQKYNEQAEAQNKLANASIAAGAALTGIAALETKAIVSTTNLAARVQTLGVVTEVLGKNVGWSADQIHNLEKSIESQGITTQAARQSIARMVQAQVDLRHASELARIAQNAAVIANTNSSEAFNHLIQAIATANVRMVRNLGMAVTFEASYKKMADTLGITTDQLTEVQKTTARVNAIMEASVQISGAYESAMETAGKKANSLARLQEQAALAIGDSFIPTYSAIIDIVYNALGSFNELDKGVKDNVGTFLGATTVFTGTAGALLTFIGVAGKAIPMMKNLNIALAGASIAAGPIALAAAAVAGLAAAISVAVKSHQDILAAYEEEAQALDKVGQNWEEYIDNRLAGAVKAGALYDDEIAAVREYLMANNGVMRGMTLQNATFYNRLKALELTTRAQYSLNEMTDMGAASTNNFGQAVNLLAPKFDQWRAGMEKLGLADLVESGELDPSDAIAKVQAYYDAINQAAADTLKEAQDRVLKTETEIEIKMRLSDTGIESAIQQYMNELEFALAGGDQLTIAFEALKMGIADNKITPDEARGALQNLLIAAEDIMAEAGLKSQEDAATFIAEKFKMSAEEALAALDIADPQSILDMLSGRSEAIKSNEARDAMLIGAGEIEPIEDGAAAMEEWKTAAEELVTPMESVKTTTEELTPAAESATQAVSDTSDSLDDAQKAASELNGQLSSTVSWLQKLKSKHITITTTFITEGRWWWRWRQCSNGTWW